MRQHAQARFVIAVSVGITLLVGAGCGPPASREELTKQVLKVDSEFTSVLDKHRELSNRIETYERELALKRSHHDYSLPRYLYSHQ